MNTYTVSDALALKVYTIRHLPLPQDHGLEIEVKEIESLLDRMERVVVRQAF